MQGVFSLCRRNQLLGYSVLAFGAGVLVGLWINSGFFAHCFGILLMGVGMYIARKK